MGKRRVFLLFFSAMALSIILMIIIYGLFIKDLDFSFNVKNPDTAPSPLDTLNPEDAGPVGPPAKIMTPEELAAEAEQKAKESEEEEQSEEDEKPVTEVVPLAPQTTPPPATETPLPTPSTSEDQAASPPPPDLHFVYLDGFSSKADAEQAMMNLSSRPLASRPYIRQHHGKTILQFGVYSDRSRAETLAQQLRNQQVFVKVD